MKNNNKIFLFFYLINYYLFNYYFTMWIGDWGLWIGD